VWKFLGGLVGIVIFTGFTDSSPVEDEGFLRAIKIRSTNSFRWEVKPEVPYRKILRHLYFHFGMKLFRGFRFNCFFNKYDKQTVQSIAGSYRLRSNPSPSFSLNQHHNSLICFNSTLKLLFFWTQVSHPSSTQPRYGLSHQRDWEKWMDTQPPTHT
jgi:hypothetical protein